MDRLLKLARRLRDPRRGCPWDLKQTIRSVRGHALSEAREIRQAILKDDMGNLCEEIGDTLWNLAFLIALAEERGLFTAADVRRGILRKMIHRHPHVFGKLRALNAADALRIFLERKRAGRAARPDQRRSQRGLRRRTRVSRPALRTVR